LTSSRHSFQDELLRRQDRLRERRVEQARFRDRGKTLDTFDFDEKMNPRLVFELGTGWFVTQHENGLLLGSPGTGKSHLAQAIGFAVIQQGHRVPCREAHVLLEELAMRGSPAPARTTSRRSPPSSCSHLMTSGRGGCLTRRPRPPGNRDPPR